MTSQRGSAGCVSSTAEDLSPSTTTLLSWGGTTWPLASLTAGASCEGASLASRLLSGTARPMVCPVGPATSSRQSRAVPTSLRCQRRWDRARNSVDMIQVEATCAGRKNDYCARARTMAAREALQGEASERGEDGNSEPSLVGDA